MKKPQFLMSCLFVAQTAISSLFLSSYGLAQVSSNLDQGWSETDQKRWYWASQGSRLMPLSWFLALEQPGTAKAFLEPGFVGQFNYVVAESPDKLVLPIGFAVDGTKDEILSRKLRWFVGQGADEKWIGMNCAACHTAQITFRGTPLRIDGGPSLADFQSFNNSLLEALIQTKSEQEKFDRFALSVLKGRDDSANRQLLRTALDELVGFQIESARLNETSLRYGFARLDAFGHIYNKVVQLADVKNAAANPSDAPVSYPFLWNIPQHTLVQWNSIAQNTPVQGIGGQPFDLGALGRNVGEVIGVFGDIKVIPGKKSGFPSSVNIDNMVAFEQQLTTLKPPLWPEPLTTEVQILAQKGEGIFKDKCDECHKEMKRTNLKDKIKIDPLQGALRDIKKDDKVHPGIGTDPWMACNAYTRMASTGKLEGLPDKYFFEDDGLLGREEHISDILAVVVAGALYDQKGEILTAAGASFFGVKRPPKITRAFKAIRNFALDLSETAGFISEREKLLRICLSDESDVLSYKARPLNGIWATAPYLHNGSVPTLYDLLLPPAQRPKSFYLGSQDYNPDKVGYFTEQSADNKFLFLVNDASGNPIPGNSNAGHDYNNADLSEDDRAALIAYMKTL